MTSRAIFVADLFSENYEGGAELTTDALIEKCPIDVVKIHAKNLTKEILQKYINDVWIFGNFASLDFNLIPIISTNLKYVILEYDYKFCKYRSIEKHKLESGNECDCHKNDIGKIVSAFYYAADHLFWMSQEQKKRYFERFPFLEKRKNTVLSSVFGSNFFKKVDEIRKNSEKEKREKWIVLGSSSWIKGADEAEKWCNQNSKDFEVVWNVPYDTMLEKLSMAEGFVYLPKGGDTCPRMVIEAKVLGCQIEINENVQHAKEDWFQGSPDDVCDYLRVRPDVFWGITMKIAQNAPSISGYTTTYNCVDQDYPFVESITSMLDCLDEVIVVDGGSTDGTIDVLNDMARENSKLRIISNPVDWSHPRSAVFDGSQKAIARAGCTGDICWQQDVDEIIHEDDYKKIRSLAGSMHKSLQLVALPVVEFWGNKGKIRIDINPWKWRMSRNYPHITHGIPAHLRKYDADGNLYSLPGSDGCDYIHSETGDLIPFANFHSQETESLRRQAQFDENARETYVSWFMNAISTLPGVYHYSWFNLSRKIKTYRQFWTRHWQSLFDITQEDSEKNNMFFDKPWRDVTNNEIESLAIRLEDEMGGWIFHRKIDWKNPTPSVRVESLHHPDVMNDWIGENC